MQGGAERIARDMNRHSAVVLQGPGMLHRQQANGGSSSTAVDNSMNPQTEQSSWRGKGHSGLDDLRQAQTAEVEGLHIQDPRRYFEHSSAVSCLLNLQSSSRLLAKRRDSVLAEGYSFGHALVYLVLSQCGLKNLIVMTIRYSNVSIMCKRPIIVFS